MNKTIVSILLDKSGSMSSTKDLAINDYNEQIQKLKSLSKDGNEIKVCLIAFNHNVEEILWLEDPKNIQETNLENYIPDGGTSLYDAIGYSIKKIDETVEKDDNIGFLFIIISDGQERDSSNYTSKDIKKLIESKQKLNNWTITYMGCDKEYLLKVSKDTGIHLDNMAVWDNKQKAEDIQYSLSQKLNFVDSYYTKRLKGESVSRGFYSKCLDECADLTSNNSEANS
jgi:uncharacterized protein YegL